MFSLIYLKEFARYYKKEKLARLSKLREVNERIWNRTMYLTQKVRQTQCVHQYGSIQQVYECLELLQCTL